MHWLSATSHRAIPQLPRDGPFVDTFDRILIAGFAAEHVSDRGHDLDINGETARLLRMTPRSRGGFDRDRVATAEPAPNEMGREHG